MAVFLGVVCCGCRAQTPMEMQPVTTLQRNGNLSTCDYKPATKEAPYFKRLAESEQTTGSISTDYSIRGRQGRYISWFGVVRNVLSAKPGGDTTLLIEQKAFDGMTDCHIMLVSFIGSGDFHATYTAGHDTIPLLSLVRVYGKVTAERNGIPEVSAEYIRVWPQMTFTFTDMGPKDAGNPEWAKLCTLCKQGKQIYNPYPDRNYYMQMLGSAPAISTGTASAQPSGQMQNQPATGGVRGLVRFDVKDPSLFLFKPENWSVTPGHTATQIRVKVSDPAGTSRVDAIFSDNHNAKLNSLTLLSTFAQQMKQKNPDIQLSHVMACKDQAVSCAVATASFTADGVRIQARYFFHADANQAVIRGYQAPEADFASKRPLLLAILTNIHIGASQGEQAQRPPINVQLAQRQAADGSWRLTMPADWNFSGSKGMVLAGAPGGAAGFLFTSFPIMPPRLGLPPTAIVSRYLPPQQAIQMIWEKFKNRQIQVLGSTPDPKTGSQCAMQIGKRCEAADVQLGWVSPQGNACVGSFKVLNALPGFTGDWFSIVAGIWGPSGELDRYMPVLDQVANSFSINDQYARQYIQQGMQNLRILEAQTHQSINRLYEAIDDNRRDAERRSATRERSAWAFSDAMLGNSYWISDIEGGKIYATDPWGTTDTYTGNRIEGAPYDYFNFEGQNPNYSSETMREVNSYDLMHMQ